MSESLLDFEIDPIPEFTSSEDFKEFCSAIDTIKEYNESMELYLEAVDDPKVTRRTGLKEGLKNTGDLAKLTGQAIGGVVDAKAGVYNATATLVGKVFAKSAKIFYWMMGKVSKTINNITDLGSKVGNIPESIISKIRGDIQLYITVGDLEGIYNTSIIKRLDDFITVMDAFTRGEVWGMIFKKFLVPNDYKLSKTDDKYCKDLNKLYNELAKIKFNPTTVDMSNPKNKEKYFSTKGNIHFTDLRGNSHDSNYYDALKTLVTDLTSRKKEIENLEKAFGEKMNRSHMEQAWAKLSNSDRDQVTKALKNCMGVVTVIGDMLKYVTTDINTMNDTVDKIIKSSK